MVVFMAKLSLRNKEKTVVRDDLTRLLANSSLTGETNGGNGCSELLNGLEDFVLLLGQLTTEQKVKNHSHCTQFALVVVVV